MREYQSLSHAKWDCKYHEVLAVQIFERFNKKVLPTEIGEEIIAAARGIRNEAS